MTDIDDVFESVHSRHEYAHFKMAAGARVTTSSAIAIHIPAAFDLGPHDSLQLIREIETSHGELAQYQQLHRGIPVRGAVFTIAERDGHVTLGAGRLVSGLEVDVDPGFPSSAVSAQVSKRGGVLDENDIASVELVIEPARAGEPTEQARLAYEIRLSRGDASRLLVDANSGKEMLRGPATLESLSNITVQPVATHYQGDQSLTVAKSTDQNGVVISHSLQPQKTTDTPPYQIFCSNLPGYNIFNWSGAELAIDVDLDNLFEQPAYCESSAAAQVALNFQEMFEMLNSVGWKGVDRIGIQKVIGIVDYGDTNAYALSNFLAVEADVANESGQHPVVFVAKSVSPGYPPVTLDIVGHELAHALGHYGWNYSTQTPCSESATVHEAVSKVFGAMLERYYFESRGLAWDWTIRDEFAPLNIKTISVKNPESNKTPGTYGVDSAGIAYDPYFKVIPAACNNPAYTPHHNASIAYKAYALLSSGGKGKNAAGEAYSVNGIGAKETLDIMVWSGLFRPDSSGYMELRLSMLQAADWRGYRADVLASIADAWGAVNVGDSSAGAASYEPADGAIDVAPWPATLKVLKHVDSAVTGQTLQISSNKAFPADPQLTHEAKPSSMSAAADPNYMWVTFELPLQADAHYYWRIRTDSLAPGACPADPQCGSVGVWQEFHAFRTSDQRANEIAPATDTVHPWGTMFAVTHRAGAEKIEFKLCEQADYSADGCIQPRSVFRTTVAPVSGQQRAELDLKVDQHYRWTALYHGPLDVWGEPTMGVGPFLKGDWPTAFHTIRPIAAMKYPYEAGVVSPWSIWAQAEEITGVMGASPGWCEFDVKNDAGSVFTQPLSIVSNPSEWHATFDVPPSPSGNFYVGGICWGPELEAAIGGGREETYPSEERAFSVDYQLVAPKNLSPANNQFLAFSELRNGIVRGFWDGIPDATQYTATINLPAGGTKTVIREHDDRQLTQKATLGSVLQILQGSGCWRVHATKGAFTGPDSEKACWKIGPDKPWPLTPANGSTNIALGVELIFEAHYTPTASFIVEVREGSPVGPVAKIHTLTANDYWDPIDPAADIHKVTVRLTDDYMAKGKTYCWKVTNPSPPGGNAIDSEWSCFSTTAAPPPQSSGAPISSIFDPSLGSVAEVIVPDFINGVVGGWTPHPGADSYVVALGCPAPDYSNPNTQLANQLWSAKLVLASELQDGVQQYGEGPMAGFNWAVLVTPLEVPADIGRMCEIGIWPCAGAGTEDFKCGTGHLSVPFMIWGGPSACNDPDYVGWPAGCMN